MQNIYVWFGYFPSELLFNQYMDQTAYRKWWSIYDKANIDLSCLFCKEMGVNEYDEDFLIVKYNNSSSDVKDLVDMVPVEKKYLEEKIKENKIIKANALICYNVNEGIEAKEAECTKNVIFLGEFQFDETTLSNSNSLAGLRNLIWIGSTSKDEKEFMKYFDQEVYLEKLKEYETGQSLKRPSLDMRCQFCKDNNIDFYYPELLKVKIYIKEQNSFNLITDTISDKFLYDSIFSVLKEKNIFKANAAFCYIPNGRIAKNSNQNILIFENAFIGRYKKPKKYIDELDNYNDLIYLGGFMWD